MNTIPEGFKDELDFRNTLPEGFKGEQKRKTDSKTREEIRAYDAVNLLGKARSARKANRDRGVGTIGEVLQIVGDIVHVHRGDYNRALIAAICRASWGARQQTPSPFANLEGKNDLEKREILKTSFEAGLVPWEEAGLFSLRRKFMGGNYSKPDFKDYAPLFDAEDFNMMGGDGVERLDRGYGRLVCSPMDVPVMSDDPKNDLTYVKVLEKALMQAFRSTVGGKEPNTLLIGAEKKVISADQIDFDKIVNVDSGFFTGKMEYNPKRFNRCDGHELGGQSEAEMLGALRGLERKTGCVVRLERDRPVSRYDVGRTYMDSGIFHKILQCGEVFPAQVEAQNIKQAMAYYIHCLTTEGWIPDSQHNGIASGKERNNSTILALGTCIENETAYGASAPEFSWNNHIKGFSMHANPLVADGSLNTAECIRVGIRKNNEAK